MSIRDIVHYADPDDGHEQFVDDLRHNDHVIVFVDTMSKRNDERKKHLFLNDVVRDMAPEFKSMLDTKPGVAVSHEGDNHVWYHTIALHKDNALDDVRPELKDIVLTAVNTVYGEHEETISRPMKVWLPDIWLIPSISGKDLTGQSVNVMLDILGGLAASDAPVTVHWM